MNESGTIRLQLTSSTKCLPVVRGAVERMAALEGFNGNDTHELTLAIDEALANVIKHGYQNRDDQPIELTLSTIRSSGGAPGLSIVVRDYGRQVDPATIHSRDLNEVRPGGLGVHIIQTVMDEVEYTCPSGGGMQLRMVKFVEPRDPSAAENSSPPPSAGGAAHGS